MANVHDDTTGAEHPGFLQKIKDKLHIGHHSKHKEEAPEATTTTDPAVSSKERDAPATDVPIAPPMKAEPESAMAKPDVAKPAEEPAAAPAEDPTRGSEFFDSEEVFSKAEQSEAHDGVPTFLVALPDQDIPNETTKEKLHHVTEEEQVHHGTDSKEVVDPEAVYSAAQEGEYHGGVPTFMVVLPGEKIPEEEEMKRKLHHVTEEEKVHHSSERKEVDPEEVFSNAQEEEHHGGVPTFLAALPTEAIPDEETKAHLHHVTEEEKVHHSIDNRDDEPEEVFSNAQEGEHHGGVPTFLVALPDQEIPNEETKAHLHHVTEEEKVHHSIDNKDVEPEEVFSNAQEGEHHGGVPTFLAALPDQEIPDEQTKEKLHHVTEEEKVHHVTQPGVDAA